MNRLLLAATAAILSASPLSAAYSSMLFVTTDGTEHLIEAENLVITFSETEMTASNDRSTLQLALTDIVTMEFSDRPAALHAIGADQQQGPVEAYGTDGRLEGRFESVDKALESLASGVWLLHFPNGSTAKISLQK